MLLGLMQEMEKAHLADDSYKFPLMVRLKQQGLMWFGLVWFGVVVLQWCYSWLGWVRFAVVVVLLLVMLMLFLLTLGSPYATFNLFSGKVRSVSIIICQDFPQLITIILKSPSFCLV